VTVLGGCTQQGGWQGDDGRARPGPREPWLALRLLPRVRMVLASACERARALLSPESAGRRGQARLGGVGDPHPPSLGAHPARHSSTHPQPPRAHARPCNSCSSPGMHWQRHGHACRVEPLLTPCMQSLGQILGAGCMRDAPCKPKYPVWQRAVSPKVPLRASGTLEHPWEAPFPSWRALHVRAWPPGAT
jgi:hypothetical protein